MKRNIAIALSLGLAAAAAFADGATMDPNPLVSSATRAQVRQEFRDYRSAGANPWADEYNPLTHFRGSLTRAQVRQELRDFRSGGVDTWADGYNPLVHFRSSLTRAEVRDEFLASRSSVAAFTGEDSGSTYLARAMSLPRVRPTELARTE